MDNIIRKIVRKIINETLDNNNHVIRRFKSEDKLQVMNLLVKTFSYVMSEGEIITYINEVTNFNKSIVVDKGADIHPRINSWGSHAESLP